ncbi:MAG: hypothetical protein ACTMHU_08645 [Cellulosimicrobium funkei]
MFVAGLPPDSHCASADQTPAGADPRSAAGAGAGAEEPPDEEPPDYEDDERCGAAGVGAGVGRS